MGSIPDAELLVRAQEGDVDAFTELAGRYQTRIHKTLLALTGNHLDAADLTQEALMRAFKSLDRFKGRSSFYTWLYRIAVNQAMNMLKRQNLAKKRLASIPMEPDMDGVLGGSQEQPEKMSLQRELGIKLKEAIDSLPPLYRASFVLVAVEGMSHQQAAEVLSCSENTMSWRIHRARKMLRTRLGSYVGERS